MPPARDPGPKKRLARARSENTGESASPPKDHQRTINMKRIILTGLLGIAMAGVAAASPAYAQTAITEQEAHAIGVDAYLYFYPLISMDITRKQSTNIEPGKDAIKGPMNMFVNVPAYP